jgi:hypothetical protein
MILPMGPCERCKRMKYKCTLMPPNPETGKADRRPLTEADHQAHRQKLIEAAKAQGAGAQKGKERARDPPGPGEQQAPSPSTRLAGLTTLTLDSGSSYATTPSHSTPAHSPATLPQPTLPEHPAPAPPPGLLTRAAAKKYLASESTSNAPSPIHDSTGASQLLRPARRQASRSHTSRSHSGASAASDGGSNASRISAVESRLDELQKTVDDLVHDFNIMRKDLGM